MKSRQLYKARLNSLLNITLAINENLSISDLIGRFAGILENEMDIGKVVVYNRFNGWKYYISEKSDHEKYENLEVKKHLLPIRKTTMTSVLQDDTLKDFDMVIPVHHKNEALAFVLLKDASENAFGMSPVIRNYTFIKTLANILVVAIENKRLYKESIKQERFNRELEVASKLQSMLIPGNDELPKNKHFHFSSFYLPHYEIGGDYYDCIQLNENEVGFCIADVSGKGISAALIMSNFQANLRALFTTSTDLNGIVKRLNDIVNQNANGEKFLTLFIAKYNSETCILEYINAGHNPPIIFDEELMEFSYLKTNCVGMGMIEKIPKIESRKFRIENPTKLLCFTDGLVEMEYDHQEIKNQNLEKFIKQKSTIEQDIARIIDMLNLTQVQDNIFDDISILGIQFFPNFLR